MKRLYKTVGVEADPPGHGIRLDGRPLNTPAKRRLAVPTGALAAAVAAEWEAQGETVEAAAMPLTQLACTALDLTGPNRAAIEVETAAYGGNDLLCYRAERPAALRRRQERLWQPLLDWAAAAYGAPLVVTSGLMAVPQPGNSVAALSLALARFDDFALTALAQTVKIAGSLVLGLALAEGRLSADAVFEAAELDESFQIAQWGEDPLAGERRANRLRELQAAERFLELLEVRSAAPAAGGL